jgi:hypothetical protein
MDVATPPRFVGATAPPPPSTPPPHQSTPWTTSPACGGSGTRRMTRPNTSEICESPLLHILAGLSSATTTPMRTTKRDVGDDDGGGCPPQPRSLSGKVLLQTLLPNLKVDEDDDDNYRICGRRETYDDRDGEEDSPSISPLLTKSGDDALQRALADMESRILAHLDASAASLSQKMEDLLQQSFANILTQQQQQQPESKDQERELSSTPSRLVRASPSPALINAFQNLCSDDQSSV